MFIQSNQRNEEGHGVEKHNNDYRHRVQAQPIDRIYRRETTQSKGNRRRQSCECDAQTNIINGFLDPV